MSEWTLRYFQDEKISTVVFCTFQIVNNLNKIKPMIIKEEHFDHKKDRSDTIGASNLLDVNLRRPNSQGQKRSI